jgi:hypothetical protein
MNTSRLSNTHKEKLGYLTFGLPGVLLVRNPWLIIKNCLKREMKNGKKLKSELLGYQSTRQRNLSSNMLRLKDGERLNISIEQTLIAVKFTV